MLTRLVFTLKFFFKQIVEDGEKKIGYLQMSTYVLRNKPGDRKEHSGIAKAALKGSVFSHSISTHDSFHL